MSKESFVRTIILAGCKLLNPLTKPSGDLCGQILKSQFRLNEWDVYKKKFKTSVTIF